MSVGIRSLLEHYGLPRRSAPRNDSQHLPVILSAAKNLKKHRGIGVFYLCLYSADTACFTDVISSFIGAISPFGIRQPINKEKYSEAVRAYAKSDFKQSAEILKESIDTEGITPESLNLIGASYRFLNKPHDALPFLVLGFKLNPKTKYLVGNIALCLKLIGYPQMEEVCDFLMGYAIDEWSKNEIKNITTKQ